MVILGAGHAGGACAALLRQYGHEAPITLVGEEPIPPYIPADGASGPARSTSAL